jgi:hypothetical protein
MEIRRDLEPVSQHLQRLLTYSEVFHRNNVQEWSHLRYKEDFENIFRLSTADRNVLEKVYTAGRDLAVHMSRKLESFNCAEDYPTLTSYIESFSTGWIKDISELEKISQAAKDKYSELESCPWAIKTMIVLFDKQIDLLRNISSTLSIMKTSDLYKIENSEIDMSTKQPNTNVTYISNVNGKVNYQSTDNSININNSNTVKLFSDIKNAISNSGIENGEKQKIEKLIDELEKAHSEGNFKSKYKEFIQTAANYMGIIGPFLPSLSDLL